MQQNGKEKQRAASNPLYKVLHDAPNGYMSAMSFRETMMAHILTWGNGYAEIVRNAYGEVQALWPIPPNRIIGLEMRGDRLWYEIRVDSESIWLPREQILHIPGLGYDGWTGYSVVAMARKSLGLGMAMETFGSHFFGQGTHPGVVVSHPLQLKAETYDNLRKSLTETYSGLGQSHRLMLLEDGMKIEKLGISNEDSQFLESRQFQIPEVARWFNLPPHKLKDLTKSSFNNIESEQISFVTDSILPWLVRLEQNYNMQLLTKRQRDAENLYFKHIVEGLLRGDAKSRAEFYQIMINIGAMTRNEVREKEDLNPDPNPLADELFIMTNMWPLSQYQEYLQKFAANGVKTDENNQQKPV